MKQTHKVSKTFSSKKGVISFLKGNGTFSVDLTSKKSETFSLGRVDQQFFFCRCGNVLTFTPARPQGWGWLYSQFYFICRLGPVHPKKYQHPKKLFCDHWKTAPVRSAALWLNTSWP